MSYQGIDWVSLSEAVVFVVLCGMVAATLAAVGGAIWAARSRRIMWERYEQTRNDIEKGTRIVGREQFNREEGKS